MASNTDSSTPTSHDNQQDSEVVLKVSRSVSLPKKNDLADPTGYPPVLVLSHPSMKELASKLVQVTTSRMMKLKSESNVETIYRAVELLDNVKWESFNDSWPNIFINNVDKIAGRDVILLASFHNPSVVFEQLSLIYSLPRYLIRSFRLILPFFPTGTMERIDTEGQIVTAKTMASLLSGIPLSARGPAQIFIFDIHALQERFYFTDLVIPRLLSAIPLLKHELSSLPDSNNLSIAFPDEGAWKRFHSGFPENWPNITCIKTRDGDKRVVKIRDGDPQDRHVVIVDDLVQTGGTLVQCAVALKKAGAAKISMYVTHAVFPCKSWEKFTRSPNGVDIETFWITDSIPHSLEIASVPPFKLISLCDAIASSLLGYDLTHYH